MTIGSQIALLRKQKGMTQEGLANMLGVSNQAVSKWEAEQCCPDVQLLPKIADIFEVSLDCLFGRACGEEKAVVCKNLPWEDDNTLRLVLYLGHTLQMDQRLNDFRYQNIEFIYRGDALNVDSCLAVRCETVMGNVDAGTHVSCGDVMGYVDAGSHVQCGLVMGGVDAGSHVQCGNIGGGVSAGSHVECKDINGDVYAGGDVSCGTINGDINAGGNINICKMDNNDTV